MITSELGGLFGPALTFREVWRSETSATFQVWGKGTEVLAYLKAGGHLKGEAERLRWLAGRVPVPRVLAAGVSPDGDWLLTEPVRGLDLKDLKHTRPAAEIIALLAGALRTMHALPVAACPFGDPGGNVVVHGDACLPNFLFDGDQLAGFVDVGDCGRGDRYADLSAAVWSSGFNLGPGHAAALLEAYGVDPREHGLVLVDSDEGFECLLREEDRRGK